jgi:hypothetical protein
MHEILDRFVPAVEIEFRRLLEFGQRRAREFEERLIVLSQRLGRQRGECLAELRFGVAEEQQLFGCRPPFGLKGSVKPGGVLPRSRQLVVQRAHNRFACGELTLKIVRMLRGGVGSCGTAGCLRPELSSDHRNFAVCAGPEDQPEGRDNHTEENQLNSKTQTHVPKFRRNRGLGNGDFHRTRIWRIAGPGSPRGSRGL